MTSRILKIAAVITTVFLLITAAAIAGPSNNKGKGNGPGIAKGKTDQPIAKRNEDKSKAHTKEDISEKNNKKDKQKAKAKKQSFISVKGQAIIVTKTASGETTTTAKHAHLRLLITNTKNSKTKTVRAAQSNKKGNFVFKNVKAGSYVIKARTKTGETTETPVSFPPEKPLVLYLIKK